MARTRRIGNEMECEFKKNDIIMRIGAWRKYIVVDFAGGNVVIDELFNNHPMFSTNLLTPKNFNAFVVVSKWKPWEGEEDEDGR